MTNKQQIYTIPGKLYTLHYLILALNKTTRNYEYIDGFEIILYIKPNTLGNGFIFCYKNNIYNFTPIYVYHEQDILSPIS